MWVPKYGGRPPAIGREGPVQCFLQVVQTKKNHEHVLEVKYLFCSKSSLQSKNAKASSERIPFTYIRSPPLKRYEVEEDVILASILENLPEPGLPLPPVTSSAPGQLPTIAEAGVDVEAAPPAQDLVTYTTYQGTPTDAEGRFCALKRKHSFN